MKTKGLVYTDGENNFHTDRFLPKEKLRELFPEAEYVTLVIQYNRRYFKKKGGEQIGNTDKFKKAKKKSKREKKTSYGHNREKSVFRRRTINL